ncbi:AfsR/SARP family transcriptional regulator [Streptomyces sp. NPDC017991]|uniref:AfsR/SARP family transcriptional regulator n=1 Tax=Streptomyces sp. NPDC017991 TaxID=3365026 RepID=UPI0037ADE5F0
MKATETPCVRFSLLGPVRAWWGDEELDLGSPQQRVVLAALLLRRGRLVTLSEMIDAVWGEHPPSAAVSVLRTYVSRLRKALAQEGTSLITSATDGYVLDLPEGYLDLDVFEQRVTEAKSQANSHRSAAAALLHEALHLFEGTPLAGLPGPMAEAERSRLTEKRLNAVEDRLLLDLQLGRHHDVIAELVVLTGSHPLRERLWQLLMLSLYRSERPAEALATYRRARGVLATELGVDPGAALREMHDRILSADPSLIESPAAGEASNAVEQEPPAAVHHLARPAQLPADSAAFVGCTAELNQMRAVLRAQSEQSGTPMIYAMAGMAGVGKSTLAVHWAHEIAHRFPDGQLYLNLRGFDPTGPIMPSEEAVRTFLDALGVPAQRTPVGHDAQVGMYRSLLASKKILIVLDNAHDSAQVRPLLPVTFGCAAIVTSRKRLPGLVVNEGAHALSLSPLEKTEAHDFLVRRLGETRISAAEPEATNELVERCAGLPLALAIVAARAAAHPHFSLSSIAEDLKVRHDSLDPFACDDLSIDVRTIFSWSYDSLTEPASRLFRLLGLASGPDISVPAAAALTGLPVRETLGLLAELTNTHLLVEYVPGRYKLHDLLRIFATEGEGRNENEEERERAITRLLSWYVHTADAAYPLLMPIRRRVPLQPLPAACQPLEFASYDDAMKWCDAERPNLVAATHQAAASGLHGLAWRLPATLWGFFYLRSHTRDWLDTARAGLEAARASQDVQGQAWALGDVAASLAMVHRYDEAIDCRMQSMVLFRKLGDGIGRAHALGNLGHLYLETNHLSKAIEYTRRGLALDRCLGSLWAEGISLLNLAEAYQRLERFEEAIKHLEEAMTVLRKTGNRWVEGITLDTLGTVHQRLSHHDDSITYYYQAIEAHREVSNRSGEGATLSRLGDAYQTVGESEAALSSWRQALAIYEDLAHPDAVTIMDRLRRLGEVSPKAPNSLPER